ncbi:phosphopantetheine-binding protein [Methylococcus sp. EFPC2]|uniref:phosphopantetheine-binding protein n=1 Tax=Methylococcus sp. EFPC2 TaxID=2812648 RepID=UPI001966E0BF|nr:phosphopantetheine-binding protein [Methylococcus sp. EFPC2]QSA98863.1 acyl carrier protein [Methylococcus sp. EFPC2]
MPENLILELKQLLIDGLRLEDISVDDIDADAPLFGGGLELDSIDALEIGVLLNRTYGVHISAGDDRNLQIFASLRALAEFVAANRGAVA